MRTSFNQRLKTACDQSQIVPEFGKGRQAFISRSLSVSQEAVRKWFTGDAEPRRRKMRELAMLLEVEESWLALGVEPEVDRKEKKAMGVRNDGAVHLLFGMFTIAGGRCAFTTAKDPRHDYIDFYCIINGTQYAIHVSMAREISVQVFEFLIPVEYKDVRVIGVAPRSETTFDLIGLGNGLVERHKRKKAGRWSILANRTADGYVTGSDVWPKIEMLGDMT